MAQCDRSRLQKDGTACLISRLPPVISIVVPFHNEELNVIEMYGRLQGVMEELGRSYQFVFVDDGSTDLTYKLLKELAISTLM